MSNKAPTDRGERSAFAVSAWPLRRKVALALAIPLLLAGTLGGLRVQSDLAQASNSSASAHEVTALGPAVDYLTAAEQGMVAAVGTDKASRTALQQALVRIRTAGNALLASESSADLTDDQRYQVDAVLDLSEALRAKDAITLSPGTWQAQLRQLQSGVTELITTIVNAQINPEPRLELLSQTLAGRFSLAMEQALVSTERSGNTGSLELFSELGVEGAAIDRLASSSGIDGKAVAQLRTANAKRTFTVRTKGTNLGGAKAYAVYDDIISSLQTGIDAGLQANAVNARTHAFVNAGITGAALLAAILLALLISRLLLLPIRRVRDGALAVAHERLPEAVARIRAGEEPGEIVPIDVTTEEEIGQLARAVDDMHRQAVILASGEANLRSQVSQMFVTLSRRNTSLVNQQLDLIERLERDEEDPKRLESLFRLDHLAARMRRTADSLLILADAPTTTGLVDDGLTVSDALQAATSGVQDYQRVRIGSSNPIRIDDSAGADVVHLLTELVDNALTYSPPTSTVTVASSTAPQGVVIEVSDSGLGISSAQLATINESLRSGGEVTPDTTRRMGLFVVSRLSQRHGLKASLRRNEDGGTTAVVLLPAAILPDVAPPVAPKPIEVEPEPAPSKARAKPVKEKARKPQKSDRKSEPVEEDEQMPAVLDVEARISAALGLPLRNPAGGAPTPVDTSTAPAALAALRPLRNEADGESEAPKAPAKAELKPVDRPVEEPAAPVSKVAPVPAEKAADKPTDEPTDKPADKSGDKPTDGPAEKPAPKPAPKPGPRPAPAAFNGPFNGGQSNGSSNGASNGSSNGLSNGHANGASNGSSNGHANSSSNGKVNGELNGHQGGALDGDWTDPGDDGFDTPIFKSLHSAWLSSGNDALPWRTTEIEAGWQVADQVAETSAETEISQSGLPVRRPGTRLVPGGVTDAPTAKVRDADAVRARLAAHASGVSRGRAAANAAPDPSQTEAGS